MIRYSFLLDSTRLLATLLTVQLSLPMVAMAAQPSNPLNTNTPSFSGTQAPTGSTASRSFRNYGGSTSTPQGMSGTANAANYNPNYNPNNNTDPSGQNSGSGTSYNTQPTTSYGNNSGQNGVPANAPVGQGVNLPSNGQNGGLQPSLPRSSSSAQPLPIDQSIVASQDVLPVFGSQLFLGNFAALRAPTFNSDYVITIGDQIAVKLWGGYAYEGVLTVDSQGFIFLPEAGPVRVLGVKNSDLNTIITRHIQKVFRNSVHFYASLETAQPVQVFVTGYVNNPGLFDGFSSSSALYFLDRAGGVNLNNGSFLDVRLMRGGQVVRTFNLYDFLLNGYLAPHQLRSGDVVYVGPVRNYVAVEGDVQNPARFEFLGSQLSATDLLRYAAPLPSASYARIYRSNQLEKFSDYLPLEAFREQQLEPGDRVAFFTDKNPKTIIVQLQGEHFGPDSYVLPYGATLADLRPKLQSTPKSDMKSLQIYRYSVALREKELISELLEKFQRQLFSRTSPSQALAQIRNQDLTLINSFIAIAKQAEPPGLIALRKEVPDNQVILEDGDVVRIPPDENLVKVQGEVIQITAQTYDPKLMIKDYVANSAGFTTNADKRRIYVIHNNGQLEQVDYKKYKPLPNDEIIIPTKISGYNWIIAQDAISTLYQLAIAVRVFIIK